jgi:hypothetical protein
MPEGTMFSLGEVQRMREPPDDIYYCFKYNAPQALLRDLHRPIVRFQVSPLDFERHTFIFDGGSGATKDTKATVSADYRIRIEKLGRTNDEMISVFRGLKDLLKQPWADAPRFGKRYVSGNRGQF